MNRLLWMAVLVSVPFGHYAEAQCQPGMPCYRGGSTGYYQATQPMVGQQIYRHSEQTYVAPRSGGTSTAYITIPDPPPVPASPLVRRPLKDDVKRQQTEIDGLKATKADAGALVPIQLPHPGGIAEDELGAVMNALDATNQTVINVDDRLQAVEAWQPLWARLDAAEKKFMAFDADKFKTEFAKELQGTNKPAYDEAQKALAEATRATEKVEGIAGTLGETAAKAAGSAVTEKLEDEGFIARLARRVTESEGFIPGHQVPVWLKTSLFSTWGIVGIGALILVWIFTDVRALIRSNGENKLTIQHVANRMVGLAGRTRNTWDDYGAGAVQSGADWSAERILAAARSMGWGPQNAQQPTLQPQPQPAAAPVAPTPPTA